MNRQELASAVAAKGLTKTQSSLAVDTVFEEISSALARGDDVRIPGFATFTTVKRAAREGINPQTGEKIQIAASTAAKFKPGKPLTERLNAPKRMVPRQPIPARKRA